MGRLIDADVLIERIKIPAEREYHDERRKTFNEVLNYIKKMPTAYDVEAKVAELEKFKELPSGCCGLGCGECEYLESCLTGEEGYKVALDRAISIVRGKE